MPSAATRRWLLLAVYGALIVLGAGLGRQPLEVAWPHFHPAHGASPRWMIAAAIAVYAVVMAVPFVPAAEIGLGLLLLFGPQVALLVYLSTVLALMLAYLIGRAVPPDLCFRALRCFGLRRAGDLVQRLAALDANTRLELLLARAPAGLIPVLLRHRYLALAVALNLSRQHVARRWRRHRTVRRHLRALPAARLRRGGRHCRRTGADCSCALCLIAAVTTRPGDARGALAAVPRRAVSPIAAPRA
jgi:hypothetical protein